MDEVNVGGSYTIALPYLIQAITPLHVGAGETYEGFVDLPIQRDNLGFPTIWSSSLKGSLRNTFRNNTNNKDKMDDIIFGPSNVTSTEDIYASSILLTDASLLLMPVRSLTGLFAFCTSSYLLTQLYEKLLMYKHFSHDDSKELLSTLEKFMYTDKCICSDEYFFKEGKAILREEEIEVTFNENLQKFFNILLPNSIKFKPELLKRIVVLTDKYADIIKRSTLVQTRIRVNYETKHVETGALWTEELLPEMSILSMLLLIGEPRKKNQNSSIKDSKNIIDTLKHVLAGNNASELDQFYVIIGGRETLGRGVIKFHRIKGRIKGELA